MGAALGDHAVGDGDNPVGTADGAEPVGDNQGGTSLGQSVEGPLDFGLGNRVQGGGGLVQNQNGGILQEDPGDGDALLLPAGEQGAPLAYIGLEALGHGQDVLVDLRLLCRLDDLFHGGAGFAVADVFQNGVGKQEHILLHNADVFVKAALGNLPDVHPVNGDGAGGHIIEPGNQLAQRGFSSAGGPYNGHGFSGGHCQRHVVKHIQIAAVGEGDFVHGNLAPGFAQALGVGGVLNGGLRGHDFHETLQTGEAVGEHLGEAAELAHGVDKRGDIQVEGDQVPVVHFPLHHIVAAEADDHHVQAAQEKLHAAVEQTHGFVELPLGGFVDFIGSVEPGPLHIGIAEGFGGADAGEAALNLLVDVTGFLFGCGGGPAHPGAQGHDHHQENGNHQSHHHRQFPADGNHHRQGAADGQNGGQQILRPVVGQLRQLEQVAGQPGHQLAGAVLVVKIKAQILHMAEQILPDVRLYPDAEGVAVICHNEVQKRAQYITDHHRRHDEKEGAEHPVGKQVIQGAAGDQREGQINPGDAHGTQDIQGKKFFVVAEVVQKNP